MRSPIVLAGILVACASAPSSVDRDGAAPKPGAPEDPAEQRGEDGGPLPAAERGAVRVHYPVGTRTLTLSIEGGAPDEPMKPVGDDTWEVTLAAPAKVRPVLDAIPSRGPAYALNPGSTLDIYPHFVATRGTTKTLREAFRSKEHPFPDVHGRPVHVYLPPSYEENTAARFPVVYMTDGQIVFGHSAIVTQALGDMRVDEALDNGAESGTIAEAIVVGIDCPINLPPKVQADRLLELTPTSAPDPTGEAANGSGRGPAFMSMIVKELKPLVDSELRTQPGREHTFFAGASLGGLMASYAGMRHGDVFGGIMAFSPAAWWDERYIARAVRQAKIRPTQASTVYIDIGDAESGEGDPGMLPSYKELHRAYLDAGYRENENFKTAVVPGGTHDGTSWAKRVPMAFAFTLGAGR